MAAALPPPSPAVLNAKIFSETSRIIKAQPRHFFALSFLFFFPPSIAFAVYSLFTGAVFNNFINTSNVSVISNNTLLLAFALGLFTLIFTVSAVGSITYSVIHGFHGQRPLKLESAIKSIATSFFRLLATNLLIQSIIFLITMIFVTFFASVIIGALFLGFQIQFSSPYFLVLCLCMAIALISIVIYLQVNWVLSSAVVVAETTWGFESLKRSASLIKGRRGLSFSLFFSLWFTLAALSWCISHSSLVMGLDIEDVSSKEFKSLIFNLVFLVLEFSSIRTTILLLETVVSTVLYVCCKAVGRGEEFAGEYLPLVVDDIDDKRFGVVSLEASKLDGNNGGVY